MEKVTNLIKSKKSRTNLSKLKINLDQGTSKNIDRIIKFISNDLNDKILDNPLDYLIFDNFSFTSEVIEASLSDKIRNTFNKKETGIFQGYELTVYDNEEDYMDIYTIPTIKLSDKCKKTKWKVKKTSSAILDIRYIYGLFKMLDIALEEIRNNFSLITSEEFKLISNFGKSYTSEDTNLGDLFNIKDKYKPFRLSLTSEQLILDMFLEMQLDDYNIDLANKYDRDNQSSIATAYQTKKNIPENVKYIMNKTTFLKDFSYVELDEDTDLSKFNIVEKEWNRISNIIKFSMVKPELRFRKLGKHKALGVYFSQMKCMCVDLKSPSSFMHELGHHIDFTLEERQLSLKYDFKTIIREYRKLYNKYIEENDGDSVSAYLKTKKDYYFAPTEIFARTFEIYLVENGIDTSFLKEKQEMQISNGYPSVTEKFMKDIIQYFNSILDFDFNALNKEYLEIEEVFKVKSFPKQTKNMDPIEDFDYKSINQICFSI